MAALGAAHQHRLVLSQQTVTGCRAADGPGDLKPVSFLQKMGYTIQEIPIFIFMGVVGKRVLLFQFDQSE